MSSKRQIVRVLPGGRIELTDPELQPGSDIEIEYKPSDASGDGAVSEPQAPPIELTSSALEQLDALPPLPIDELVGFVKGPKRSVSEIDKDLRSLRDEWD